MNDELCRMSLKEASNAVRHGTVSPVQLTRACLESVENGDKVLNSFIEVYRDHALADAKVAEEEIAKGQWRGPLHGIPVAIKDLIDMKGRVTTAASRVFLDNVASEDAGVVKELRVAGAVILGKNNLHEFAYGGSGVVSCFGPVRNPRDTSRISGGSSSGSAAAVAAGFCFASIGTDTAGSIRLPAACCGVVGFKPGFGSLSLSGVVPLAWSYDHMGPITRTIEDAEIVCNVLRDDKPTSIDGRRLRIGVARKYFLDQAEPQVGSAFERVVQHLAKECRSIREVIVPADEDRTVSSSESWQFHQQHVARNPELYDPRTLARIRSGEKHSPEAIAEKRQELQRMRAGVRELFQDVDVIVMPTSPILPPTFAELEAEPEKLRAKELLMLRNTRVWNVFGSPAISVPCGEMIGVQLSGLTQDIVIAAAKLIAQ